MTPSKTVAAGPLRAAAADRRAGAVSPSLLAAVAALLAAALYIPSLQYGWVWSDASIVASQGRTLAGFHPAVAALFRGEWLVGIGTPGVYHLVNLTLHAAATWLLFVLARGAGASPWVAFGASLLFAAHPIHVEAVAHVSGRPDLLATAAAFGALVIARSAPVCGPGGCRSWRVYPAYALLAIAVLSDEVALVTPLVLIALDRWGSPRVPTQGRTTVYFGFAAVAIAGLLARIGAGAFHWNPSHDRLEPGTGIWGSLIAAREYLRAMVFPYPLNAIRALSTAEASSWATRTAALLALASVALAIVSLRRDPVARAGAVLLLLPLLPALPIPPFEGGYVAERAAYFASAGFCLLAVSLLARIASISSGVRPVAVAVAIGLVALGSFGTLRRLPVWSDNVALLDDTVRLHPKELGPRLALADQYASYGHYEASLRTIDQAIAVDSTNAMAFHKRTILLIRMGRLEEAEASARRSVQLKPDQGIFWANLGDLLTRRGATAEATKACRRAVSLDANNPDNWYNFGVALAASDSLGSAAVAYRRAIVLNPGYFQAINNLGAVLGAMGRMQEARDAYERAVEVQPSSIESRMNLAIACLQLGDTPAAARQREAIQRMDPSAAAQLVEIIKQTERAKAGAR